MAGAVLSEKKAREKIYRDDEGRRTMWEQFLRQTETKAFACSEWM
jgi:hypothetical protein